MEFLVVAHSNTDRVVTEMAKNGEKAVMRRGVLSAEHPVVIVHPVIGEKALYVNPIYTKSVLGYDDKESSCILRFLFNHIA